MHCALMVGFVSAQSVKVQVVFGTAPFIVAVYRRCKRRGLVAISGVQMCLRSLGAPCED